MPDSVEDIAYAVGGAFVSPGLGSAELLLALIVALAFLASAVQTLLARHRGESHWRQRGF
jgi:hypothetical protein